MSELAKSMLAVQKHILVVGKDTDGYGYKYATLTKLVRKLYPILSEYGLTVMQPLDNIAGEPAIRTIIVHAESGEKIDTAYPLSKVGMAKVNDAQQFGAAISYARRYGLASAFGVVFDDEDDDAASLSEPEPQRNVTPAKPAKKPAPAVRAGNPYGIPGDAWLKLDATKTYAELLTACGEVKDRAREEGWSVKLNEFFRDRSAFLKDIESNGLEATE